MPAAFIVLFAVMTAVLGTAQEPARGSRVVSHPFHMGDDWKPEADVRLEGTHVYPWTIR